MPFYRNLETVHIIIVVLKHIFDFQNAAEKLAMTCSTNKETDLDKIVVSLNPEKKEFVVEPLILQVKKCDIQVY